MALRTVSKGGIKIVIYRDDAGGRKRRIQMKCRIFFKTLENGRTVTFQDCKI